jgi:RNA polymerase sigma-70 factor, ECF subfamily
MSINPMYHQNGQHLERELDWIQQAKDDPQKFAPLYKKYYEMIFRYIYQRMDDKETSFDVTSQVFIKAMNNIQRYEYRGVPFSSWLFRIAKSELAQYYRNEKGSIQTVNVETVQLIEIIHEFDQENDELNLEKLKNALLRLKEKELQMIEMRFFESRSFKEIGEILEMTENNAKVTCFRALEKLKRYFIN